MQLQEKEMNLMGRCPIKLLTDHLANQCFIQGLFALFKVLFQGIIDHRLISGTSFCRAITKFFNYIIIEIYRNPSLPLLGNNRASFSRFKFIFLLHSISSPRPLPSSQKSYELNFPYTYRPPRLSAQLNRNRLLQIFFLHRYFDLQSLVPSHLKVRSQHPRNELCVSDSCFWLYLDPIRCS